MIDSQKHIIHKVRLDVFTHNKKVAYKIKNTINVFLEQDVFPYIERYFESIENQLPSEIMQVQKLAIELDVKSQNNFEELAKKIKEQVSKEIQQLAETDTSLKKNTEVRYISAEESNLKSFFYFLEEGLMPWWNSSNKNNIFIKDTLFEIVNTNGFTTKFLQRIQNSNIRKRFVNQFSDKNIQAILSHVFQKSHFEINILDNEIIENIQQLELSSRTLIWIEILNYLLSKNQKIFIEKLNQVVGSIQQENLLFPTNSSNKMDEIRSSNSTSKKEIHREKKNDEINELLKLKRIIEEKLTANKDVIFTRDKNSTKDISVKESTDKKGKDAYYIQNAGLILLHPFLNQFFKNCKLLNKENKIINIELAIHLLHYVATKKEKQYEHTMAFEKFICGVPISQSIKRNILISKKLKAHVDELLNAMIGNWNVLQNSSHDLLRNEFLQRPGKLNLNEEHPKLIIERKTQDILLDKITWNIALCKLPWREKIIFTDW